MSEVSRHNKEQLDRTLVSGLAWTTGAKWVTQVVSWLSVVLGARLLSPADFGLMDMAGFVAMTAGLLAEFGLGSAVLQIQDMERRVAAQLNTISLFFGLAAIAISALLAPVCAAFFRSPGLIELILWNSLGFLPMAFQAIPQGLLQRDLEYRKLSLIEAAQAVVQAVLMIACAYNGLAYWSFVISVAGGRVMAAVLVMIWRPVPFLWPRWQEVSEAVSFGTEVSLARLGSTLAMQADGLVIGRMLGETQLGVYRFSISLASAPADKVGLLLMRVTGPLFAKVQDDVVLMRRYFLMISDALALVLLPLMAGFIVVARDLIALVLGPQWQGAVAPAQWLAAYILIRGLSTLMGQALTSLRETRFQLRMSLIGFAVMPAVFYGASSYGTAAVASAWLLMSPITIFPLAIKLFRVMDCSVWTYLKVLRPSVLATTVMVAAVLWVALILPPQWMPGLRLLLEVGTGMVFYSGVIWLLHRERIWQYVTFLQRMRQGGSPADNPPLL